MITQSTIRRPSTLLALFRLSLMMVLLIGLSTFLLVTRAAASPVESSAALAPSLLPPSPGWPADKIDAAFDPDNRRGHNPAYAKLKPMPVPLEDNGGAGSANFQFTVPVLSLPGRGLDVNLALHYNSLLWYESDGTMFYSPDADWPALGWSLGFGYLQETWVPTGIELMIFDADGTRHEAKKLSSRWATLDGTFIDVHTVQQSGGYRQYVAKHPNGSTVEYTVPDEISEDRYFWYPSKITDANGNTIEISYGNNRGPQIETITDTLGRVIRFYYEDAEHLTAIVGPGIGSAPRVLVRLLYEDWSLNYAFAWGNGKGALRCSVHGYCYFPEIDVTTIKAIYFPDTQTGYWFGDEDSYSGYGMLRIVGETRGMEFSGAGALNRQGSVTKGLVTRTRTYNYLSNRGEVYGRDQALKCTKKPYPELCLSHAPTYDTMTETWEGMNTPAVTRYNVQRDATPRRTAVTYPDGSRSIQLSYNKKGEWDDGLVYDVTVMNADGTTAQHVATTWERGVGRSARIQRIQTGLGEGTSAVTSTVEYSYGPDYNQVIEVREYDYDGATLLRRTQTDYVDDPNYTLRHIFNLPRAVRVYQGTSTIPASLTEYSYDGEPSLEDTPGIQGHSTLFDPIRAGTREVIHREKGACKQKKCVCTSTPLSEESCSIHCPPGTEPARDGPCEVWEIIETIETIYLYDENHSAWRGNVTEIRRYADAANHQRPLTEKRRYDIAGNLVSVSMMPGEETRWTYTAATQYAYPESVTQGSTDPTSSARLTTSTVYNSNTGLAVETTDANGQKTTMEYDLNTLLIKEIRWPTGAVTRYNYHYVYLFTRIEVIADGKLAASSTAYQDGRGLTRRQETSADQLKTDITETKYDTMGRIWKQSLPYRDTQPVHWNETTYDALGRAVMTRAADGSEQRWFYDEGLRPDGASAKPGHTMRTSDAWGRERWMRYNALGQLEEVVMPRPDGNGSFEGYAGLVTTYSYDALGDLLEVRQAVRWCRPPPFYGCSLSYQNRRFRYDSLGRLTHQYLPERSPMLDDRGRYVVVGAEWSDFYEYDAVGNLIAHVDSRGVKTVFGYFDDPLRRVRWITFDTSGFGDTNNPILPSADVGYIYRQSGDVTQIDQMITEGVSTEQYEYDAFGRAITKTVVLADSPSPLVLEYTPDSLNRPAKITYPAQYGLPTAQAKDLVYSFDYQNRLASATFGGQTYASSLTYNAAGQLTNARIGSSGLNQRQYVESYVYDSQTGLLQRQTLVRGGTSLLDLSYDYLRNPGTPGRTGQVTKLIDNLDQAGSQGYFYDAWGRLAVFGEYTSPTHGWVLHLYGYDDFGNRTNVAAVGLVPPCTEPDFKDCQGSDAVPLPEMTDGIGKVTYDQGTNRITLPGYGYDAAGSQTRAQRADGSWQRYQYDAAGRLVKVTSDDGAAIETYIYAGGGNHRIKTEYDSGAGGRRYYVWNGDTVIAEYGDGMKWLKSYVYLGSRLLATLTLNSAGTGEVVQYHHPDRLGTRLITGGTDSSVSQNRTFPYGTAMPGSTTDITNQRFTSYDRSSVTGLDYAVNRTYDPYQGRFMEPDPIGIDDANLPDPQSLNMYAYVGNDPRNAIDPLGLRWVKVPTNLVCEVISDSETESIEVCTYEWAYLWEDDPPVEVSFDQFLKLARTGGELLLGGTFRRGPNHIDFPSTKNPPPGWQDVVAKKVAITQSHPTTDIGHFRGYLDWVKAMAKNGHKEAINIVRPVLERGADLGRRAGTIILGGSSSTLGTWFFPVFVPIESPYERERACRTGEGPCIG